MMTLVPLSLILTYFTRRGSDPFPARMDQGLVLMAARSHSRHYERRRVRRGDRDPYLLLRQKATEGTLA